MASAPTTTAERLALGSVCARGRGSSTRGSAALRVAAVARLGRAIAHESGAVRLAVRVRSDQRHEVVVVAYPWRHRERAEEMGRAVAAVLDAAPGPVSRRPSAALPSEWRREGRAARR